MIQIKKSKYDNYCTCCRKPFDDSMEVSFSHKDYNDSVNITLCGKCRAELMEALGKDTNVPANSALDHIHNVVAEREYQRGYKTAKEEYDHKLTEIKGRIKDHYYNKGYKQGKADANCPEIPDSWIPVTKEMPEEHDTMFAKFWGTDKWNKYMFRGRSELVEVTVELEDGTRYTDASRTRDGKWDIEMDHGAVKKKVVAWKPMSAPWRGNVDAEVQNNRD